MTATRMIKVNTELKRNELIKVLKRVNEDKWEYIIRGMALEAETDPEEGEFGEFFEIGIFPSNSGSFLLVECTFRETFEIDEDGEFVAGSDFDHAYCMTAEQIEKVRSWLF